MDNILDEYMEVIQEEIKSLNEGIILKLLLAYIIFLVIVALKSDYNLRKVRELVKEILPLVKKDLDKLYRSSLPKVLTYSRQLYNDLNRLKGIDANFLRTMMIFQESAYSDGPTQSTKEVLKDLLDRKLHERYLTQYINHIIENTVDKYKNDKRKVKIVTYIYGHSYFSLFGLYFYDDSYDMLPGNDMSNDQLLKVFRKIENIVHGYEKRINTLCAATFKSIEDRIRKFLGDKETLNNG
jgi:hypothetical protein